MLTPDTQMLEKTNHLASSLLALVLAIATGTSGLRAAETAAKTPGVGALKETLKWGQPSYLTQESRSGSMIRIDRVKPAAGDDRERYALYVHCQTTLVSTFRQLYRDELVFGGNRSILLDADRPLPKAALKHCIALALTYHRNAARDYL